MFAFILSTVILIYLSGFVYCLVEGHGSWGEAFISALKWPWELGPWGISRLP